MGPGLLAVVGAALGTAVAVVLHFAYRTRVRGDFLPSRSVRTVRYGLYAGPEGPRPEWLPMLVQWAMGGLVVALLTGYVLSRAGDFATVARLFFATATLGAIVGLAVATLLQMRQATITYGSEALARSLGPQDRPGPLRITFVGEHQPWLPAVPSGAGIGLLAGVALGTIAMLARVRASSPALA